MAPQPCILVFDIGTTGAKAAKAVRVERELRPEQTVHAQYQALHEFHRSLYPRLKRSFAELARLTEESAFAERD